MCEILDRVLTKGVVVVGEVIISVAEIERLGTTFMQLADEMERLKQEFGVANEDLNIDLGPLGSLF